MVGLCIFISFKSPCLALYFTPCFTFIYYVVCLFILINTTLHAPKTWPFRIIFHIRTTSSYMEYIMRRIDCNSLISSEYINPHNPKRNQMKLKTYLNNTTKKFKIFPDAWQRQLNEMNKVGYGETRVTPVLLFQSTATFDLYGCIK